MRTTLATAALAVLLSAAPSHASTKASSYDSEGRRDPFRPAGTDRLDERDCPGDGSLRSLRSDEVRLHGLLRTAEGPAALLDARDARGTRLARASDELCDGRVEAVDYENRLVVLRIPREDPLRPWRERILRLDPSD